MRYLVAIASACFVLGLEVSSTAGSQDPSVAGRTNKPSDGRTTDNVAQEPDKQEGGDRQEEPGKQQAVENYRLPFARGESLVLFLKAIEGKVPDGLKVTGKKARETDPPMDPLATPQMNVRVIASRHFLHALTPFVRVTTAPPAIFPEQAQFLAMAKAPPPRQVPPAKTSINRRLEPAGRVHVVAFRDDNKLLNSTRRYLDHSFLKAYVKVKGETLIIADHPELVTAVEHLLATLNNN